MKKNKKSKKEVNPVEQVSELELELANKKKENEQLKAVIEEREKLLKKYNELEATERLTRVSKLAERGELENDDIEDETIDFSQIMKQNDDKVIENKDITNIVKKDEFEKLLEQFNEQNKGTLEVYKIDGGRQIKIGKFSVKEIGNDLDSVARKFGGGEYKLRLRNPDGTFAGEITEYYDEIAYPKPITQPIYNPFIQNNTPDITTLIAQINQQNEKNQMLVMNMMLKMIEGMTQRNQFITSIKDIVELKEVINPKTKDENPVKNIEMLMEVLLKGIELGKMHSEGGGDEGLFNDLLKVALSTFKGSDKKPSIEQVFNEVKQKVSQNQTQNQIPQVRENPPVISQDTTKGDNMSDSLILKMYKPFILQYAKENKNPHDVAVQIFSKIPEQYLPICYDFCNLPTRVDEAINYIPELKDYREWSDKVLEEGKKLIEEYFKQIEGE